MSTEAKKEKPPRRLSGVKEWAQNSVNIQIGCENNCRYCYARDRAVRRFKYCQANDWKEPRIDHKKVDKNYSLLPGGVMFPTTHDITDRNISEYLCVAKKLLEAGNDILIASKPRWSVIPVLCETLFYWKKQIEFRFTIGSVSGAVLKFWEPGAPGFYERRGCLQYAFNRGYKTSVSCEPFLDPYPHHTYAGVIDFITDGFWLGLLRDFDNRVVTDGVSAAENTIYVKKLRNLQDPKFIKLIYNHMKDLPQIRWKDSIRKICLKGR